MHDFKKLAERYKQDPEFHQLVQLMENLIAEHKFGITELREAAFFATCKYAMENQRYLFTGEKLGA